MKPKDYISKKAAEEALKAYQGSQLNSTQETSPYFVGKINSDRTKITDPTGRQYNLIFTGNPKTYELAQRLNNDTAVVNATPGKTINVDGTSKGFRYIFSPLDIAFAGDPIKNYFMYVAATNRLYAIPTSLFGTSSLFGVPITNLKTGVSSGSIGIDDGEPSIPLQNIIFTPDGKGLFGYSIVVNEFKEGPSPTPDFRSYYYNTQPFEVVWFVATYKITSEETEEYLNSKVFELVLSNIETGSFVVALDNFASEGVIADAFPPPAPPEYSAEGVTIPSSAYGLSYFMNMGYAAGAAISGRQIFPVISYVNGSVFMLLGVGSVAQTDSFIYEAPFAPGPELSYVPSTIVNSGGGLAENLFLVNLKSGNKTIVNSAKINYSLEYYQVISTGPPPLSATIVSTLSNPVYFTEGNLLNIRQSPSFLAGNFPMRDSNISTSEDIDNMITFFSVTSENKVVITRFFSLEFSGWFVDEFIVTDNGQELYHLDKVPYVVNNDKVPIETIFAYSRNVFYLNSVINDDVSISPVYGFPREGEFYSVYFYYENEEGIIRLFRMSPKDPVEDTENILILENGSQVNLVEIKKVTGLATLSNSNHFLNSANVENRADSLIGNLSLDPPSGGTSIFFMQRAQGSYTYS